MDQLQHLRPKDSLCSTHTIHKYLDMGMNLNSQGKFPTDIQIQMKDYVLVK